MERKIKENRRLKVKRASWIGRKTLELSVHGRRMVNVSNILVIYIVHWMHSFHFDNFIEFQFDENCVHRWIDNHSLAIYVFSHVSNPMVDVIPIGIKFWSSIGARI